MLPTLPTRERLTLGYFHCNNKLIKNKNKYKYKNPSQPPHKRIEQILQEGKFEMLD